MTFQLVKEDIYVLSHEGRSIFYRGMNLPKWIEWAKRVQYLNSIGL